MRNQRKFLTALVLTLTISSVVFGQNAVQKMRSERAARNSQEKIAMIIGGSIVVAGVAIGAGIFFSRKNQKDK